MNNKAESPIEISLVILVSAIVLIGFNFVFGTVFDNIIQKLNDAPISISNPVFQSAYNHLMQLLSISYQLPLFASILLIIWGIKAIIRKQLYTTEGDIQYVDEY